MELSPLNNSVIFKKLFREPAVLTEFVKDLTGVQLNITSANIELEKKFTPSIGLIDVAFDIFAEDPERRVVVEIQRVHYHYLLDRFEHYHNVALMEMQRSYQKYTPERTVYTIIWLTMASDVPPYNQGLSVSRRYFESTNGTKAGESRHRLYLINPRYRHDPTIRPEIADWMALVQESIDHPKHPTINLQRPIFQTATQIIAADTVTPTERAAIMDEHDFNAKLDSKLEEGRKKATSAIAQAMLDEGVSLTMITRFTGLSEEELQSLPRDKTEA